MNESKYVRSEEDGQLYCMYCDVHVGQLHDEECPVVLENIKQFNQNQGKRYNKGKCPKHLRPIDVDWEVCWNYGHGAEKYGENDWKKGQPASESYACAKRHIDQFMMGNEIDPETNLNHLAAAITNLEMMLWNYWHKWPENPDLDDREIDTHHPSLKNPKERE